MTKPEKVFKMGAVRASIFANSFVNKAGLAVPLKKVVLEVRYKDKQGEWKGTNSLSLNDLPKAITALQQAYEYLLSGGTSSASSADETSDSSIPGTSHPSQPQQPQSGSGYPRMIGSKHY